jgi:predicted aspartyl protease
MRRSLPGAAPFLLAGACTVPVPSSVHQAEETRPGAVPFSYAGPGDAAIVVDTRINGQGPFRLVVDTGATLTCVDNAVARQLELPEKIGIRGIGAGARSSGAVRLVSIASLELGEARATDLTACTLDLTQLRQVAPDVHGLLGLNVLRSYRMVLDFERQTLRLEPPGQTSRSAPPSSP